jgi:signal transduction histidine kinase
MGGAPPRRSANRGRCCSRRSRRPRERALAALEAGGEPKSFEALLSGKDGQAIPVLIAFSTIRDFAGTVVGTSAISQDLTEKKRMLEALIQSEKLAEIGRMGSGIVHEIKNPLTSIMMMSDIIVASKDLPEKTRRYADVIQKESQRILRLSQNILSFARPQQAEMRATDVGAVLQDTLGLVEYELRKAKVRPEFLPDRDAPPVWADREKLKQIFLNLVVNAAHAMPEGGSLEVRTLGPGRAAWSGRRPGPGLARSGASGRAVRHRGDRRQGSGTRRNPAKIFEPFFSTKGEGQGTGLGLYICRNIVLEHKGRIEVASAVGSGTMFGVSPPVAARPGAAPAGPAPGARRRNDCVSAPGGLFAARRLQWRGSQPMRDLVSRRTARVAAGRSATRRWIGSARPPA